MELDLAVPVENGVQGEILATGFVILVCLLSVIKTGIRQCSPTGNVDVDYIAKL